MKNPLLRSVGSFVAILALVVAISLVATGCSDRNDIANSPSQSSSTVLDKSNPAVKAVMDVQDRHSVELMKDQNVAGVMTGMTSDGRIGIIVLTKNETSKDRTVSAYPSAIEGIPVGTEYVGVIRAMKGGGTGVSHTAKQTPPIQLGTSGGWRYDLANGYCCGGTLGSLIQIGGNQYVLSNYHVLWADIVSGGNSRVATTGDPVIQPGLIDISCNANNAQNVATLAGSKSLPNSNVDAAIAQVVPGMVSSTGSILEIGTLSASTVNASIGQLVKKSGRTTGLTRSKVSGLNATISVAYENECAGGSAFTKTFTGQIVIANKGSGFLNSGDSGSLMVEDITTNPRAVGLLFAGGTSTAIANPIGQVLSYFGATMVGN